MQTQDNEFSEVTPLEWDRFIIKYEQKLEDPAIWDSVPLYNHTSEGNFRDHQLVRFRGMIQDMLDPECFFLRYAVRHKTTGETKVMSGRFRDVSENWAEYELLDQSEHNKREDRSTFYVVSIPGVNAWVLEDAAAGARNEGPFGCSKLKRAVAEMGAGPGMPKKPCSGLQSPATAAGLQAPSAAATANLGHPLYHPNAKSCYVKIYDWNEKSFLLNDMVEVVGFLSLPDSAVAGVGNGDANADTEDGVDGLDGPNESPAIPRLHAVRMKKIAHTNPLLGSAPTDGKVLSNFLETFMELRQLLTQVMMGDQLAAEYLIYNLVGNVYARHDGVGFGQLPLNLHNVPSQSSFIDGLSSFLTVILEKNHRIDLTVEGLNTANMIPSKNYKSNRLITGELQLTENTHILVNENTLQAGQLGNKGCLNVAALREIAEKQTIKYDFGYYPIEYKTNLCVLVLSEGVSLMQNMVTVKMVLDAENVAQMGTILAAANFFIQKEPLVTAIRKFITSARLANYLVSEEMQQKLELEFVRLRSEIPNYKVDDYHRALVIARLASICRGQNSLTSETWQVALALEKERVARVN